MRCVAVIEAQRPGLDSVILWTDDERLVAVAYLEGQVKMTRPLNADSIDAGVREALDGFQVVDAQVTTVSQWAPPIGVSGPSQPPVRWT